MNLIVPPEEIGIMVRSGKAREHIKTVALETLKKLFKEFGKGLEAKDMSKFEMELLSLEKVLALERIDKQEEAAMLELWGTSLLLLKVGPSPS